MAEVSFCFVDVFHRALVSAVQTSSGSQTGLEHEEIMSSQPRLRF